MKFNTTLFSESLELFPSLNLIPIRLCEIPWFIRKVLTYNNLDFCFCLKLASFKLLFGIEATISTLICLSMIALTNSLTFFLFKT